MAVNRFLRSKTHSRPGTRERILDAGLELFNERGERTVTTNHIAAHLGISPGNLYYHFRNREEIVRGLFPRFLAAVHGTIVLPEDRAITAEDVGRYHRTGTEVLWDFRFLQQDPRGLVERDPGLAELFGDVREWLIGQFCELFRRLIAQGRMRRPARPADLVRVATNAVILWSNWVNFVATLRPSAGIEPGDMAEGAIQSFLTFAPYLEEDFAAEVRAFLDAGARA